MDLSQQVISALQANRGQVILPKLLSLCSSGSFRLFRKLGVSLLWLREMRNMAAETCSGTRRKRPEAGLQQASVFMASSLNH